MVRLRVIGDLREAANMAAPTPREEQRYVLRKLKIAILRRGLRLLGGAKRGIKHHGKRKCFEQLQRGVVILAIVGDGRLGRKDIAVELEFSTEGVEFGRRQMARRASQAGLSRIARHGLRLLLEDH